MGARRPPMPAHDDTRPASIAYTSGQQGSTPVDQYLDCILNRTFIKTLRAAEKFNCRGAAGTKMQNRLPVGREPVLLRLICGVLG